MTIRIEVTNPAEHQPSELRAVATFLNNLAADREAGRIADTPAYRQVGDVAVATHSVPLAVAAAPGASSVTETKQAAADAQEDSPTCDTSEADVNGVYWDARIHAETKTKNKDGSWRQKRGVDGDLVQQVLNEQQQPETDDAPPAPVDEEEQDAPPAPVDVEDAPPVPADVVDVKPAQVIKFITENKIPAAEVNTIVEGYGLKRAADLFGKPELAADVLAALQSMVG